MVGTSCTADAVYIILAVMWYIVVDYQTNIVNVYSSRNNIGSNQNIDSATFKFTHNLFPLGLLQV